MRPRRLLYASLSVMIAGIIDSSILSFIWPDHWPSWAVRMQVGILLAGFALTGAAALTWLLRK